VLGIGLEVMLEVVVEVGLGLGLGGMGLRPLIHSLLLKVTGLGLGVELGLGLGLELGVGLGPLIELNADPGAEVASGLGLGLGFISMAATDWVHRGQVAFLSSQAMRQTLNEERRVREKKSERNKKARERERERDTLKPGYETYPNIKSNGG
jgi:hypothetical protein